MIHSIYRRFKHCLIGLRIPQNILTSKCQCSDTGLKLIWLNVFQQNDDLILRCALGQ